MFRTLRAVRFLFVGPMILLILVVINWMTSPHHWWVQWAALGIGIAWFFALFRVISALIMVGGIAAVGAWLMRHRAGPGTGPGGGPPPMR